ncbi:MAG: hypothetical protein C0631_13445 [Sedimenticola sp.]|nr:MAG: hypothetical protein C0631_13445 [Sedimenticola sp.]
MKIKRFQFPLSALSIALALCTAPAMADDQALRDEVRMLKERLMQLEQRLEKQEQQEPSNENGSTSSIADSLSNGITISGAIEVEASRSEDYDGVKSSDITVATVELGIDAQVTDWVNAHVLLLHEEDGSDLEVDEAIITLANPDQSPFFFSAGRMYLPFGSYDSNMVSDPLTLGLGETRETAIQLRYEGEQLHGSVYLFNGDTQKGGSDHIDQFGLSVGFSQSTDDMEFGIGAGYINNIGDSDALGDLLGSGTVLTDYVGGFNLHGLLSAGPFTLIGEYVTAQDSFAASEVAFNGSGAKPSAWHLELGYNFNLMSKDATVAASYNNTDEALALELPERRYGAALSVGIFDSTTLSLEWMRDKDYGIADGGSGNSADTVTTKLAVEF